MKINDRILLGIVTGLVGSIPGRVLNEIEYRMGLTDLTYEKAAASVFVKRNELKTTPGKILGVIANQSLVASAGVATSYVLSATGRDHAITKGIGVKMLYWMLLEGIPSNLGISVPYKKATAPLLSLVNHIIFGASCGYFASKWGDDSLFPTAKNQLPLIASECRQNERRLRKRRHPAIIKQQESSWVDY